MNKGILNRIKEIHCALWRTYQSKLMLGYKAVDESFVTAAIGDTVSHYTTRKNYFELLKSLNVIERFIENDQFTDSWIVTDPSSFHYQTNFERNLLTLEKAAQAAKEKKLAESQQPEEKKVI
jgi:hypothetical protein